MSKCPLEGTNHYPCTLLPSDGHGECQFKHTCEQMQADSDRTLLNQYREAMRLVRYYESAEGDWGRETSARLKAKDRWCELFNECKRRGLDTTEYES